ncbi:hypothetical protein MBH78_20340 [Oceanimonas sp. NS1]|nr:hypothetical protein [Oceanimonas sp. NS1]
MARLLDEYGWSWFEAPVSDYDYATYQRLVKDTNLEISSHGNCLLTLQEVAYALANNMWSDVRQDATVCGGITPLNKCLPWPRPTAKPGDTKLGLYRDPGGQSAWHWPITTAGSLSRPTPMKTSSWAPKT